MRTLISLEVGVTCYCTEYGCVGQLTALLRFATECQEKQ